MAESPRHVPRQRTLRLRGSSRAWRWLCVIPVILFLGAFFVGPVVVNLLVSLQPAEGAASLSLANYARVLGDAYHYEVALRTTGLGAASSVLCLVIGYPLAYAIARAEGTMKAMLIVILVAPLLVNVVVRSYGWMILIGGGGLLDTVARTLGFSGLNLMYSWAGILVALVHVLLPFMVLSIASTLDGLDPSFEEAATLLGATPLRRFWHVTLPLSIEGVITGCILTFTMTIGSFVTVMLLGDTSTMVLPLLIYQRLTVSYDWPSAATLGVLLLLLVTVLLCLQGMLLRWVRGGRK